MPTRRTRRLYRGRGTRARQLRAFKAEYGPRKGPRVYGAVIGKVARERAAANGGTYRERVRGHWSTGRSGRREFVRAHPAQIRSSRPSGWHRPHRHGHGEHPGPCSKACRAGQMAHPAFNRRRRR